MATESFRRKKIFVEKGLQLRFARFVILFVLISCLVTGLLVFYTTFMMLGQRLADVYPPGRLVSIFRTVHLLFVANILIMLPIIFYGSIVFSHRIAGPLPKIYRILREIGQGNFDTKIVLRQHDELKDLAEEINQMALHLKEREIKK